ncbi:STAS domain-containing protein [Aquabacterium sp.]|uniref:STAS domain-containing protein n=1 Tax=Aquabacterium sp. TaxID=1872578 RepID=UPI002D08AAB5|nr:STAS domain-containing protein [Aquabacterium sp.]HSW04100.1 STAS domain-containing protein [Aquabacterium sp.]
MELTTDDLNPDLVKVMLEGRLDTPGVDRIETRFNAAVVATGKHALVDLTQVSFLSSMGIRMLISAGRAMQQRKTRLVLFGAQPLVRDTFEAMSIDQIIDVADSESQAMAVLAA